MLDEVNNYAVWEWSKQAKRWLLRGRFPSPKAAAAYAGQFMIVIDVLSDKMIWWRGTFVSRAKPYRVPKLELEVYGKTIAG